MLMLALESSAKAASAAVFAEDKLLGLSVQNGGLTHSRTLLPMAESLLKNMDKTVRDVELVAVAHGPGSFTGLRIGMAEAKGLCWALEIPVVGVSTLEAMAYGGPTMEGAMLCCAMDARRGQVYNALFTVEGGKPQRLTPDRAISVAELEG
jgi:tRNA threonylcarbamoyladenosine biosynthesis protein TsaB